MLLWKPTTVGSLCVRAEVERGGVRAEVGGGGGQAVGVLLPQQEVLGQELLQATQQPGEGAAQLHTAPQE